MPFLFYLFIFKYCYEYQEDLAVADFIHAVKDDGYRSFYIFSIW